MLDRIEFEPHRAKRYRKRSEILAFESKDAITYFKSWGQQDLPKGGWVAVALDYDGRPTEEVYGIDADAFAETYAPSLTGEPHRFMKTATIEAYLPGRPFMVTTEIKDTYDPTKSKVEVKENRGSATAMLVRNPGGEVYTIEREEFDRMYVEVAGPRRAKNRDEHLDPRLGPKRILCIDGGGARSLLSLGTLAAVENQIRERHDDAELRLCDYFDLIAGTSTGAVIAAALASGQTVSELTAWYRALAPNIFKRQWTPPLFRPKHDPSRLREALGRLFEEANLASEDLCTGLLVITKRLDARGVWPVANNPADPAWSTNADFVLKELLRASAAAPFPLQAEEILVAPEDPGLFVNGGVSPHNNPALQALLTAARSQPGLGWPVGADRLFMLSVGTGASPQMHQLSGLSIKPSIASLHTMLTDAAEQIETMMQWLSESDTSRVIDSALGNLQGELLAGEPLLSYARYDARLQADWLKDELGLDWSASRLKKMRPLDARAEALDDLLELGLALGRQRIKPEHFPAAFDLATAAER